MNPSLDRLDPSVALDPATTPSGRETVIPVFEEELSVAKRVVETARVRVSRVTHNHQQLVDELLQHEKVEVERVPVDRQIEAMPSIRQEGDVTIIPVVEEVLKVERHLVLKEEVHIRRIKQTERYQESVTLRRQEALVSRLPTEQSAVPAEGAQPNETEPRKEYK
jgi:uncharacterized protein (TIGR02271 family)